MLISVHMPKTAGMSFRATLEERYGERFTYDYADYPLAHAPLDRHRRVLQASLEALSRNYVDIDCIHGHYLPVKYLLLGDKLDCRYITWMREPVARLVSHYHYWFRTYDPESDLTSPLHRKVVEENWSLEDFCFSSELRNVYSQYLWGFPVQRLDFIGITEFYEEDLRYFSNTYLGQNAEPRELNRREIVSDEGLEELNEDLRASVEAFHAADAALYRFALQLRAARQEAPQTG